MDIELRKTRSGKIRRSMCVEESHLGFAILKNVSVLRLTYQIKVLAYKAVNEEKMFFIDVPEVCEISAKLESFIREAIDDEGQELIEIKRI